MVEVLEGVALVAPGGGHAEMVEAPGVTMLIAPLECSLG